MIRMSRYIRPQFVSTGLRWTSHGAMKTDRDNYGNIMRRNNQLVDVSQDEILKTVDSSLSSSRLKNQAYTIGDYGAADGSTTIGLIRNIIDIVREKCGKDKEIHVIYEDIPTNDFNCLVQRHNGLIPEPRSYCLDYENVYVTTSSTSFFKQCVPSNTLDLLLSFTAVHFLSRPIVLTDSYYRFLSKNEEEKEVIKKIAAEDWLQFWRLRGKELKPGGCAIVSSVGETKTKLAAYNIFKLMNDIVEKCESEQIITKNEKENTTFTACFRTAEEMKEPFINSKILTDMGLHLCQVKQETVPCFFTAEWEERLDKGIDDREKFARDFTSTVRTYSYSSIYRALSNDRTDQEKNMICERFFEEYETALRNSYPPDLLTSKHLMIRTSKYKQVVNTRTLFNEKRYLIGKEKMIRMSRYIRPQFVSTGLRWTSHGAMKTDRDNYGNIMKRCKQLVDVSKDEILKTVDSSLSSSRWKNQAYTIGDYGAADGSTTIGLIRSIIDIVREKCGKDKEIHVIYEDIPTNDFNCLVQRHNGLIPEPRSYCLDYENVYVTASGTPFFKQCVPSNTLDLLLSFTAVHFLSRPIVLTDNVYRFLSKNEDEQAVIKKIAAEDWLQFWRLRGKELKPERQGKDLDLTERETCLHEEILKNVMNS